MDPNACLKRLRKLSSQIFSGMSEPSHDDVMEMAELVQSLDQWIVNGGFLPDRWAQPRKEPRWNLED